jgi:hypothetical protein
VNYLRMFQAVAREEIDIRQLEGIIKGEASVLYRLLRYLNSPMFGMRNEIHSIRHALAILGEREIRRWIRLVGFPPGSRRPRTWCSRLWFEHISANNSRGKFRVRNRTFFWSAWCR